MSKAEYKAMLVEMAEAIAWEETADKSSAMAEEWFETFSAEEREAIDIEDNLLPWFWGWCL